MKSSGNITRSQNAAEPELRGSSKAAKSGPQARAERPGPSTSPGGGAAIPASQHRWGPPYHAPTYSLL